MKPWAVRAPLALFMLVRDADLHAEGIGGIDAGNAHEVAQGGAAALGVISALFGEAGGAVRADVVRMEGDAHSIVEAFGLRTEGPTPPASTR